MGVRHENPASRRKRSGTLPAKASICICPQFKLTKGPQNRYRAISKHFPGTWNCVKGPTLLKRTILYLTFGLSTIAGVFHHLSRHLSDLPNLAGR